MPSCWIETDLEKVRFNFRALQEFIGPQTQIIAVVKADAYGLGAVEVGRTLGELGARYLAVTHVEEGVALRRGGIQTPILMMAPSPNEDISALVEHDLTACISQFSDIGLLGEAARQQNKTALCGLKINTGMNRFGVRPEEALDAAQRVISHSNLKMETCWTHFMDAGEAKPSMIDIQYGRFLPLVNTLCRVTSLSPNEFHCCNSSALLRFPALQLSCVRSGTLLFGQFPDAISTRIGRANAFELHDPFAVCARVLSVQNVNRGESVGYGGEWTASNDARVATLGVGFADGLMQQPQTRPVSPLQNVTKVLGQSARDIKARQTPNASNRRVKWRDSAQNEHLAHIIGRVAMQSCLVDVTHLPGVRVDDVMTVSMRRTSAGAHLPRRCIN